MRAYAAYDGKSWLVQAVEPNRKGGETVVQVIARRKTPRAAIEEAERWNRKHGQA